MFSVSVQPEDFNVCDEYDRLAQASGTGAVVFFVGKVRELAGESIESLTLEHYPGMTERAIKDIVDEAAGRWPLIGVRVVHRVGALRRTEQIVFVGVASAYRAEAFAATNFIMDYLKTRAPFWKKEKTQHSERWLEVNEKDVIAAKHWE